MRNSSRNCSLSKPRFFHCASPVAASCCKDFDSPIVCLWQELLSTARQKKGTPKFVLNCRCIPYCMQMEMSEGESPKCTSQRNLFSYCQNDLQINLILYHFLTYLVCIDFSSLQVIECISVFYTIEV